MGVGGAVCVQAGQPGGAPQPETCAGMQEGKACLAWRECRGTKKQGLRGAEGKQRNRVALLPMLHAPGDGQHPGSKQQQVADHDQ